MNGMPGGELVVLVEIPNNTTSRTTLVSGMLVEVEASALPASVPKKFYLVIGLAILLRQFDWNRCEHHQTAFQMDRAGLDYHFRCDRNLVVDWRENPTSDAPNFNPAHTRNSTASQSLFLF